MSAHGKPAVNPWLIAVTVSIATFMEVLDTSIANVSLTHIAGNLSAGLDESTWVLTSYLVSNAIILPISGWLSDAIGRKRFYMSCVALFTISSFLCGFAPNLGSLVFFRVLQGLGGGGLAPSEQAILADTFEEKKRGMAFAVYGIAVVVAPAIGPTLGGFITDHYTWRWIFFLNVPFGILSLFLCWRIVPKEDEAARGARHVGGRKRRIDFLGFGLVALGLGSLQIVLDKGQREDWFAANYIIALTVIAAVSLVWLVIRELRIRDPIVDIPLLKDRNFLISNLAMVTLGIVLFGTTQLLPQFVQTLLGYTATDAGLVISPGGFFVMLLMPVVGFLVGKTQPKYLIACGFLMVGLASFHMAGFNTQISYAHAAWARVYQAAGIAFLFIPINSIAFAGLPKGKNNNASAIINLSRNLGGSFGISLAQTLLAQRAQHHQNYLVANISPYNPAWQQTLHRLTATLVAQGSAAVDASRQAVGIAGRTVTEQATMLAFIDVFWVVGAICLAVVPFTFLLRKTKGGASMAH